MKNKVWYHHCMDLQNVRYGEIVADRSYSDTEEFWIGSYNWLESQVGFYPFFLGVGVKNDVYMTGYDRNWKRFLGSTYINGELVKVYQKKGDILNKVLFSFQDIQGVFTDYEAWHLALNAYGNRPQKDLAPYEIKMIFKKSWSKSRWLRWSIKERSAVQLVTPKLDLRTAKRIWVRNKKTKLELEKMGFKNVQVKRISCLL